MDTAQWPQEIVVKPMDEIIVATNNSNSVAATCSNSALKPCITSSSSSQSCKKAKPQKEVQQIINCPRCNSTNTKFCYYNNYSLSQPRYFCKTCRRYWTEGGSLRNIPVGGGTRKNNKRSSNSSPSSSLSQSNSSISSKKIALTSANNNDHRRGVAVAVPLVPAHVPNSCQNPNKINLYGHHQDLNLGFTHDQTANDFKTFSQLIQAPSFENIGNTHREAMESLTGLQSSSRGLGNSFMPMLTNMNNDHNNISASNTFLGFPLNASDQYHQFMKPVSALSFSLDNELGMNNSTTSTGPGSHLFPFEDLKLQATDHNATDAANTTDDHSDHDDQQSNGKDEHSNGFWTGMLGTGGGGSW